MARLIGYLLLWLCVSGCSWYSDLYEANVDLKGEKSAFLYIHTGDNMDSLANRIAECAYIQDKAAFLRAAELKDLHESIKPGRFALSQGMTNNTLINQLKSGKQVPVKVVFHSIRTIQHLAGKVGQRIEADSVALLNYWLNTDTMQAKYGVSGPHVLGLFLPNTYEFYWNTSPAQFTDKLYKNYESFWNEDRLQKAKNRGLTPQEVVVLASIVQSEQSTHKKEWPQIAGLYLNRLKINMLLQSDPTVVFAVGDFTIRRVLDVHKAVQSPYNTYLNTGLPPGPILLPEPDAVDAVLNAENHNYLYMCAKDDFSGLHAFSENYAQHQIYARNYQRALNKRKIYK